MQIEYIEGKKFRHPTITKTSILGFFGDYRFLSNFELCTIKMKDGNTYPSTENAYMAYKTLELELRKPFITYTPSQARKEGQLLKLRPDWEKVKLDVMRLCLEEKFKNPSLAAKLIATAPKHLEEQNDWNDRFWGTVGGFGKNNLGKLLMGVRDRLIKKENIYVSELVLDNFKA